MTDAIGANAFGRNYPLDDLHALAAAFGIEDGDRVLDVGGAGNPFPRADVVCDLTFASCAQRNGAPGVLRADVEYVEAPAESLPFDDDAFDFVWCTQTLEHVTDPEAACRELCRVAKRGFVEVPSRAGEVVNGNPTHRWIVDREGETLVFHPRPFVEHPLKNAWYGLLFGDDELHARSEASYRNLFNHQLLFEGEFGCRVVPGTGDTFDYDVPAHAARAHFDFARNVLLAGAPAEYGFPDALEAARVLPESGPARWLLATYQIRLLRLDAAEETLAGDTSPEALALRTFIQRLHASEPIPLATVPIPGPDPYRGSEHPFDGLPLVSVLVCGEDPPALLASVEAALTQDYPRVEVIVASAGPLDPGFSRLGMPDRLRAEEHPQGTSEGTLFNRAAEAARGDFIAFLLAGDRPLAHHLERALARLLVADADAVHTDRLLPDGTVAGPDILPGDPGTAAASLSTVVARKTSLGRVGWFDEQMADAPFEYLNRVAETISLQHVKEATLESPHLVPEGAEVLDAARASSRLRPLELHRALIGAAEKEAGLRRQVAALEQRVRELEAERGGEEGS